MKWWKDFMQRVNAANTHNAIAIGNQRVANQSTDIAILRLNANTINRHKSRCRIGRITLKGNER